MTGYAVKMICQFLNEDHMLCFLQTDILNRYRYIDVSLSTEHAGGNHGPISRFVRVFFYGRTDPGRLHWGAALSAGGGGLRGEEAGVPRAAGADLPAFSVRLDVDTEINDATVLFGQVDLNVGGGFDASTGMDICIQLQVGNA